MFTESHNNEPVAIPTDPESWTSNPPNLEPGLAVLTDMILSSIRNCDDVTYKIDAEPKTVKLLVTINEPEMVSFPTTVNNEPSNVKLLSAVTFGDEPLSVNIPLF